MSISVIGENYKIVCEQGRYTWAGYLLFVLISSLIGDTIILLGSTRYQAFRLNKCVVVVLQHIAVCDIVACWGYVIPTLVSLLSDRWILGDHIANLHLYLDYLTFHAAICLTCALAWCKLLLIKRPFQTRTWTRKDIHKTCLLIWISANIYPIFRFILDTDGIVFSYISYNINFGLSASSSTVERTITYTFSVLTVDIPTLGVMIAISLTLEQLFRARKQSRRSRGKLRWQGIVTVLATAVVFCVSVIPHRVSYYVAISLEHRYRGESNVNRSLELLTKLNIVSNFYIYSLTVPSFRGFVRNKVLGIFWR